MLPCLLRGGQRAEVKNSWPLKAGKILWALSFEGKASSRYNLPLKKKTSDSCHFELGLGFCASLLSWLVCNFFQASIHADSQWVCGSSTGVNCRFLATLLCKQSVFACLSCSQGFSWSKWGCFLKKHPSLGVFFSRDMPCMDDMGPNCSLEI